MDSKLRIRSLASKAEVNIFTSAENELVITRTGGNTPYERGAWRISTRVAKPGIKPVKE